MKYLIFSIFGLLLLTACSKDVSVEEQFTIDTQLIEDYVKANNLTVQKTVDGVYIVTETEGSAEKPKITSTVTVGYKGYFLDGVVFDSSDKAILQLYRTIEGWQIGIPKFGRGGKGKILIPSKYGYGTSTSPGRANAVLVFDIEVFDF